MVLPGITLFPHAMLPLFIFEAQYREMLADALAKTRLFCVGRSCEEGEDLRGFREIGAIGMVRACVAHPDGTSHLILQGLERVHFGDLKQESPFRICRMQVMESTIFDRDKAGHFASELRSLCRQIREKGAELPAPLLLAMKENTPMDALADLTAATFVQDVGLAQQLLEEVCVEERLKILLNLLTDVFDQF